MQCMYLHSCSGWAQFILYERENAPSHYRVKQIITYILMRAKLFQLCGKLINFTRTEKKRTNERTNEREDEWPNRRLHRDNSHLLKQPRRCRPLSKFNRLRIVATHNVKTYAEQVMIFRKVCDRVSNKCYKCTGSGDSDNYIANRYLVNGTNRSDRLRVIHNVTTSKQLKLQFITSTSIRNWPKKKSIDWTKAVDRACSDPHGFRTKKAFYRFFSTFLND